jgi:UDP-2-acetamido-3-amino-2,3-dideoxy-glucuronate N-acetyltransferase
VFIHPSALCESEDVGPGTRVWAFAHVMAGAIVGRDCNICGHAFIESGAVVGSRVTVKNHALIWHRVTLEDDVFVGPAVVFTNDLTPRVGFKKTPDELVPTRVRRGASVGANATIRCGVTIGERALIGAGSVVLADVPSFALVAGNPAAQVGWACECGARLPHDLRCDCGRRFVLADARTGLVPAAGSP